MTEKLEKNLYFPYNIVVEIKVKYFRKSFNPVQINYYYYYYYYYYQIGRVA